MLSNKIKLFFTLIFLMYSFVFANAQIGPVNLDETYVRAMIRDSIILSDATDPTAKILQDSIQKLVKDSYDNRPLQDIQQILSSDASFKEEFIRKLMLEFAPAFNNKVEADRQAAEAALNSQSQQQALNDTSDPTKADFQIVQPECIGDQSNNKHVQGMSVKDSGYCGWRDLIALINRIIKFCVYIAAALSTIAFAYAGFLYMTAFGNSGKIEEAHGIFKKTFMGILFVLMGWLLVYTLLQVLGVKPNFSILKQP